MNLQDMRETRLRRTGRRTTRPRGMRLALLVLMTISTTMSVTAQQKPARNADNLPDVLNRLQSPTLSVRTVAFTDLLGIVGSISLEDERVKLALIRLLEVEDKTFLGRVPGGSYTEAETEYFAQVIDVVSSIDDVRALPALVGAMSTGGMAVGGVLKYGQQALSPVLAELHTSTEPVQRMAALATAVAILKRSKSSDAAVQTTALVRASLNDSDPGLRTQAVMLIECLGNRRDFVPVLEQVSKNDTLRFPGKADDAVDSDGFYPVRFQARRVLRAIQSNSLCIP